VTAAPTAAVRRPRRSLGALVLAVGAVVATAALLLSSGAPAQASWTAPDQTSRGTTSTGRLAISLGGADALAASYSSTSLAHTTTLTISNTGSVPAPWRLDAGGAPSELTTATRVVAWSTTAARCGALPTGSTLTTWAGFVAPTGTLPPGSSATWCLRTSVGQGDRFGLAGRSTAVTATVTARLGAWSATSTGSGTQTVADTVTPGAPQKTSETDTSISLTWAAPADSSAVSRYGVYRADVLVGTVAASSPRFTDTGLGVLRYYAYSIRSLDASSPSRASPASPTVLHATGWLTSSSRYVVRDVASGRCVTAGGSTAGSPLLSAGCGVTTAQTWQFVADGSSLKVVSPAAPGLYWDSPSDHASVLRADNDISAQRWSVVPVGSGTGQFQMRDRNGLCLTSPAAAGTAQLQVAACGGAATQLFTLDAS